MMPHLKMPRLGPRSPERANRKKRPKRTREERRKQRAARRGQVAKVVVLVAIFLFLALPAVFVNTLLGYLPALFYGFALLMSFCYGRLCARFLEFDELLDLTTCVRGKASELLVRLRNKSILFMPKVALEFSVNNNLADEAVVHEASVLLPPRFTEDLHLDMSFAHIGEYTVGLRRLIVLDPLMLFTTVKNIDSTDTVLVTPRNMVIRDVSLTDAEIELDLATMRTTVADGLDYHTVRDYAYGDPMKRVHWKLSSRMKNLVTKVFEQQSNPSLDVYIDFETPEGFTSEQQLDVNDLMVEAALALSEAAFQSGLDTRLLFLKDDEVEQFSLNYGVDIRSLVRALPRIGKKGNVRFGEMLLNRGTSLYSAANIAVCSSLFSSDTCGALERVRLSGRNALAFAAVPHGSDRNDERVILSRLSQLEQAGVHHALLQPGEEESQ